MLKIRFGNELSFNKPSKAGQPKSYKDMTNSLRMKICLGWNKSIKADIRNKTNSNGAAMKIANGDHGTELWPTTTEGLWSYEHGSISRSSSSYKKGNMDGSVLMLAKAASPFILISLCSINSQAPNSFQTTPELKMQHTAPTKYFHKVHMTGAIPDTTSSITFRVCNYTSFPRAMPV